MIEDVLETFMTREDYALRTIKAVPLDIQSKYYCSQFKVVRGIVDLVILKLPRGIGYELSSLHKNAT